MDEVTEAMRELILSGKPRGDWELTTIEDGVWIISITLIKD